MHVKRIRQFSYFIFFKVRVYLHSAAGIPLRVYLRDGGSMQRENMQAKYITVISHHFTSRHAMKTSKRQKDTCCLSSRCPQIFQKSCSTGSNRYVNKRRVRPLPCRFLRAIFYAVCLLCFGRCLLKQTFLYFPFII